MRGCLRGAQSSEDGRSMFESRPVCLFQKRCKAGLFAPGAMGGAKWATEGLRQQIWDRKGSTQRNFGVVNLLRRVG